MATCGSFSLWCAIGVLAAVASIGMSQATGGSQQTPSPDNCTAYNSNTTCQFPDLAQKIYCLANGSYVTGYCETHEAVCGDHVLLQDNFFCSQNQKVSSTTSKTSTTGSSSAAGSKVNQHSHTDDHDHERMGEHREHDGDSAAPLSHTPGHVVMLCGVTAVAYASRLFALL